eukprot:1157778-Pelagomonas_calceolata.AAC.3
MAAGMFRMRSMRTCLSAHLSSAAILPPFELMRVWRSLASPTLVMKSAMKYRVRTRERVSHAADCYVAVRSCLPKGAPAVPISGITLTLRDEMDDTDGTQVANSICISV